MLKEEHLVLLRGGIDSVLYRNRIISVTITSSSRVTSADEAARGKILVLWLGLGVILSVIQQVTWSGHGIDGSLELLRAVW
jgi:hypothetical protein